MLTWPRWSPPYAHATAAGPSPQMRIVRPSRPHPSRRGISTAGADISLCPGPFAEVTRHPVTRTLPAEVRKGWSEECIQTEPPATFADLRAFESAFKVRCPEDFATYLTTLGGMKEGTWD